MRLIAKYLFVLYKDIPIMKELDVVDLVDWFQKWFATRRRISFDQRRVKKIKALLHWVYDYLITLQQLSISGLKGEYFKQSLNIAAQIQEIWKIQIYKSGTVMKEVSTGELESETKW